jgi:hypothetical protein
VLALAPALDLHNKQNLTTKNLLVALTATSPPSHQARKLKKIAILNKETWTTTALIKKTS